MPQDPESDLQHRSYLSPTYSSWLLEVSRATGTADTDKGMPE